MAPGIEGASLRPVPFPPRGTCGITLVLKLFEANFVNEFRSSRGHQGCEIIRDVDGVKRAIMFNTISSGISPTLNKSQETKGKKADHGKDQLPEELRQHAIDPRNWIIHGRWLGGTEFVLCVIPRVEGLPKVKKAFIDQMSRIATINPDFAKLIAAAGINAPLSEVKTSFAVTVALRDGRLARQSRPLNGLSFNRKFLACVHGLETSALNCGATLDEDLASWLRWSAGLSQDLAQAVESNQFVVLFGREIAKSFQLWTQVNEHDVLSTSSYAKLVGEMGDLAGTHYSAAALIPERRWAWIAGQKSVSSLSVNSWALFPDCGRNTIDTLATKLVRSSACHIILGKGSDKALQSGDGSHHVEDPLDLAEIRFCTAYCSAYDWLLKIYADFWLENGCFAPITAGSKLLAAHHQRLAPEGIVGLMHECSPSRPSDGDLAVMTSADSKNVKVTLGTLRAEVAACRQISRSKRFGPEPAHYYTLKAALASCDVAIHEQVEGSGKTPAFQIPLAAMWRNVDLIAAAGEVPDLMCNFQGFVDGEVLLDNKDWEANPFANAGNTGMRLNESSLQSALRWLSGTRPFPLKPAPAIRSGTPSLSYLQTWQWQRRLRPIQGAVVSAQVRVGTKFFLTDQGGTVIQLAAVRQALAALSAGGSPGAVKGARDAPGQSPGADGGENDLAASGREQLANSIRDFAKAAKWQVIPYLEIDGAEFSESEWLNARRLKTGAYELPSGKLVAHLIYEEKCQQLIDRKRVLAKFVSLSQQELWKAQSAIFALDIKDGAAGGAFDSQRYLADLQVKIESVFSQLDELLASGDAASILEGVTCVKQLRPYQSHGVVWMYSRLMAGFGVCLADEMGLGKTIQSISLLQVLKSHDSPSLVICPKSVLLNWRDELARFAPGLRVTVVEDAEDLHAQRQNVDVVLTTYPRLRLNEAKYAESDWNLVILDEAHSIKNSDTQIAQSVRLLRCSHRLALTGTPIENHAKELWSQLDWLNPGMLGSEGQFVSYTNFARSSEQKAMMLRPLRQIIGPIMLQRTKRQVALDLPDKIESSIRCAPSPEQAMLYKEVLQITIGDLAQLGGGLFAMKAAFLKAILHCKQICNHPDLFFGDEDREAIGQVINSQVGMKKRARTRLSALLDQRLGMQRSRSEQVARSGKLSALVDLLKRIRPGARGVIIFSQFKGSFSHLEEAIALVSQEEKPYGEIRILDGQLSAEARRRVVEAFNSDCRSAEVSEDNSAISDRAGGPPILLLSLRAGGQGINLTGADHVIHFDRWWNPAVEAQATDRAHRIGQSRTVFVHHITTEATIEDSIERLFREKRQLAEDLLGGAEAESVSDALSDQSGFIHLVDPLGRFLGMEISDATSPGRPALRDSAEVLH